MTTRNNASEIETTYKTAIASQRAVAGKWTPAKSAAVSIATLACLQDDKNKVVALTDDDKLVIEGVFNPTSKSKLATITHVLAQRGIELDEETESLVSQLFNAPSVQKQIDDLANPKKRRLKDVIAA